MSRKSTPQTLLPSLLHLRFLPFNHRFQGAGLWSAVFAVWLCAISYSGSAQVSLHFAGDNDWVTGSNASLPQGNAARTIEGWVKYNTGNDMSIFNYGTFANNQKFTLHLYNGVYIIGEGNDLSTGYHFNDGNWHHIAVTHNGATTIVYVDGIVRGTRSTTYNTTGTNFQLGVSNRNGSMDFRFQGNMDNIRVWNVARTQQQLQDNMYANFATATNLVASYDLNEGVPNGDNTAITTVIDGTGNANGTLSGFTLNGTSSNYVSGIDTYSYDPACPTTTAWDGATWSNGEPDADVNALVNSNLTISAATEACGMLVANGVSLTITSGNALTVHGELVNEGIVRVEADATGLGSLITLGNISGSGQFIYEQYLTGSGGATPDGVFYYVSSPVAGATAATYDLASGNKLWNADEATQTYPQITNEATTLTAGKGYVARMGATDSHAHSGTSFNTGDIDITGLTRTGIGDNAGYNLVGNPYPSTVNWNSASITNLETSIWFRTNDNGTMLFDTYNTTGNVGTNNNGNGDVTSLIPPTQAFWVRVMEGEASGSLSFDNADRSHQPWAGIYRLAEAEGMVRLTLANATASDETIVHFNTDALDSYDDFDSQKMWAANIPQFYTTVGEDTLVINGLFSSETSPIVDLGMKVTTAGDHSITATSITVTDEVWLEDRLLNIFQQLNIDPVYDFTSDAGNIPTRFALHFGALAVGVDGDAMNRIPTQVFTTGNMVNVSVGSGISTGTITIMDMTGRTVQTAAIKGSRTVVGIDATTGIYLVRVETAMGVETSRVMLR